MQIHNAPKELVQNRLMTLQTYYVDISGNMPAVGNPISVYDVVFSKNDLKEGKWLFEICSSEAYEIIQAIKIYNGCPCFYIVGENKLLSS